MANDAPNQSTTRPLLMWAPIEGYDIEAMRNAVLMTSLPARGDCRLVWVNTGDLAQMGMTGQAEQCK